MILFWLGFIYLSTELWGCLWITSSSWSGKESLAWQDGSADWLFYCSMLKWRWEGIAPFHHKSSLRFRDSFVSHSGIRWSDCQSFLVLSSKGICVQTVPWHPSLIWPQERHTWSLAPLPLGDHRFQVLGSLRAGIKHISCSIRALQFGDGFLSAENEASCSGLHLISAFVQI